MNSQYSDSDLAFLRLIYDALNDAIAETKRGSCFSNFQMDGVAHTDLHRLTLNGRPLQEVLWGLGSFFLSYSHGDPDFENKSWQEGWRWLFEIRSELAAVLSITLPDPPPIGT